MVACDAELRAIQRLVHDNASVSGGTAQIQECDQIFIKRLIEAPKALTLGYWESHFEWQAVQNYPEISGDVLDFGCGSGHSDIFLARAGYNIHGIDVSPVGIAIANYLRGKESVEVRERLSFEVVDVMQFRDQTAGCFDSAWSSHVFEHLADPSPILAGLRNWLKPGATMLISVPLGYAYADPGHINHFANGEELKQFLGDSMTVVRLDISQEFQVIRALCRFRSQ